MYEGARLTRPLLRHGATAVGARVRFDDSHRAGLVGNGLGQDHIEADSRVPRDPRETV